MTRRSCPTVTCSGQVKWVTVLSRCQTQSCQICSAPFSPHSSTVASPAIRKNTLKGSSPEFPGKFKMSQWIFRYTVACCKYYRIKQFFTLLRSRLNRSFYFDLLRLAQVPFGAFWPHGGDFHILCLFFLVWSLIIKSCHGISLGGGNEEGLQGTGPLEHRQENSKHFLL